MSQEFKYDVFLSHSSKDKVVVRELAERLKADGVRVWFDEWIIQPGDAIGIQINKGLEESRVLVLAISDNASESDWVTFEHQSILFNDPTNKTRRFIPLRLDASEIPFSLRQFAYIDWRKQEQNQYQRLLSVASHEIEELETNYQNLSKINAYKKLAEHVRGIISVAISSDGLFIATGSNDRTIRIWETKSGKCIKVFYHQDSVLEVVISSNNELVISGGADNAIKIWEVKSGKYIETLRGHKQLVLGIAVFKNSNQIVSSSYDGTLRVWNIESGKCIKIIEGDSEIFLTITISSDGRRIFSGDDDSRIKIWDIESGKCLKVLDGHSNMVRTVALSSDDKLLVSGSFDKTIRIWNAESGRCLKVIEGHLDVVRRVAISKDNKIIVSSSDDKTVRVWSSESGRCLGVLKGHSEAVLGVAISPIENLVVSGSDDRTVRIWNISSLIEDKKGDFDKTSETTSDWYTFYTNAKVLLVGDSGVGKSGLAYRLTQNEFVETISTDGVWATQMILPNVEHTIDTEREIWLWDFAGQSDYRLIHQLFMDETSLAVLVFNPQADNPFEGLGQWDRDLQKAARRPFKKLLVAGRCDRGGLIVSRKSLDDFRDERKFVN